MLMWSHECTAVTIGHPHNLGGAVPVVVPVTEGGQN